MRRQGTAAGKVNIYGRKTERRFLAGFPNWCGTGEEYKLYRLMLG
jgi:hypothetical protein